MLQKLQDVINLSHGPVRNPESARLALARKYEHRRMIELEVFVRIRCADDRSQASGVNITAYLDPNIRSEIETIFGIVEQYARSAITELHSQGQMKINGYDVILNWLPKRVEIYSSKHSWPHLQDWRQNLGTTL